MAKAYNVVSHTEDTITLKRAGLHLGPAEVVLLRTQIAAIGRRTGRVMVATTDGHTYVVNRGLGRAQRELVADALRMV